MKKGGIIVSKTNKKETIVDEVKAEELKTEEIRLEGVKIEKMDSKEIEIDLPPHVDVKPDILPEKPKRLGKTIGLVVDCNALRIREGANRHSKEIGLVPVGTKLKIDLDNSTESFYEVIYVSNDITQVGFCVKEFIKIGD